MEDEILAKYNWTAEQMFEFVALVGNPAWYLGILDRLMKRRGNTDLGSVLVYIALLIQSGADTSDLNALWENVEFLLDREAALYDRSDDEHDHGTAVSAVPDWADADNDELFCF